MNPVQYESIVANIASVTIDGSQVQVTWKCPATNRMVGTSVGTMEADQSLGSRVSASVKRSIASEVIYGAARLVSSLLGGAAGRVVSNAVYTAANDINTRATSGADYSEASRRAAIVRAFEVVEPNFEWNAATTQFVANATQAAGNSGAA